MNAHFKTHRPGLDIKCLQTSADPDKLSENNKVNKNKCEPKDQRKMGLFKNKAPQINVIENLYEGYIMTWDRLCLQRGYP